MYWLKGMHCLLHYFARLAQTTDSVAIFNVCLCINTHVQVCLDKPYRSGERKVSGLLRIPVSAAVLAEMPLKSPRKLFILIIKKYIHRIKVSKNKLIQLYKKNH